ncbi:MAG TPA: DUF3417 domain-containing protein, partial [Candidatus Sulfotelmatobacter sp.]|nr:DUF3417 domain-containing protein [Candidatus Sulfotelmatobacter sp.]
MSQTVLRDGGSDVDAAVADLAARLPAELAAHARLAYNYRWSWTPGGRGVFRSIDPVLWERSSENPVRLLREASSPALERAAGDRQAIAAAQRLRDELEQELASPGTLGGANTRCPVAFLCAEFAVHPSLPIYAGGLGVLAGDMLKEASDRAVPMVGVGLLYHQGYFIQRIDNSGYQHEYWLRVEPERLPAVLVRDQHGKPLTVRVPIRGREVIV